MSPFARHHRTRPDARRRRWSAPAPRVGLTVLVAALLVASGLLAGPGLGTTVPHPAAVTLLDNTTNDNGGADNSGGNNNGGNSGGNDNGGGSQSGQGGAQNQGGKTDQQAGGGNNDQGNTAESTDFPGRDKIGKAGPDQYVDFTGTPGGAGAAGTGTSGAGASGAGASGAGGSGASGSGAGGSGAGGAAQSGATNGSGSAAGSAADSTAATDSPGATGSAGAAGSTGADAGGTGVVSEEAKSNGGNKNNNNNGGGDSGNNKNGNNKNGNNKNDNSKGSGNKGGGNKGGGNNNGGGSGSDNPGSVNLADKESPEGGQFSAGSYSIRCSLSNHRNSDNPLLAPGKVNGAQHAHDYAGNNSANAQSNTASLEQATTTCTNGDQSPVFWPVLRDLNGVGDDVGENGGSLDGNVGSIIEPTAIDLTFHGHGTKPVEPMPLTMVLSEGAAKSATENGKGANAKYTCSGSNQFTDLYPLCPPGSQMQRVFDFPSCWNGRDTDSADHISHILYPDADGNCEADEVPVPALRLTLSYPAVPSRTFAVDTFPQEQHNPITDHALMEYLSSERRAAQGAACINAGQRCVQGPANNPAATNGTGVSGSGANGSGVGFLDPQDRVPPSRNFTSALATHAEGHDHYQVDLPGAPTLGRLLGGWQLDVLFAVVLALLVGGYAAGMIRVGRRGRRWPWPRTLAWTGGVAVVALATCSGWASYAEAMFSVHMTQHMALLMVAPMLLALGAPVTLARTAAPDLAARVGARLGRGPRVALHPAVVLAGVLAADWGLYFSGLFSATLTYHWTHSLLDLAVLVLGGLFAYTVLAVDPTPTRRGLGTRLGLLLAAMPAHVGFALAVGNDPHLLSASFYRVLYLRWVPSVVADQHTGGAVAAAVGELGLLVALIALLAGAATGTRGVLSGPYTALARRVATFGHSA